MTREALDSTNRAEVAGNRPIELVFIHIPLSGGDFNVSSGDKSYAFGGDTYVPWAIGGIDSINENRDRGVERSVITISGCDADTIAAMQVSDFHWTSVKVYLGYLDSDHDLVATPYKVLDGYAGAPTFTPSEKTSTISITVETLNAVLGRLSQVRGCDADQAARGFTGDTIFHQVGFNGTRVVAFGNWRHEGLGRHENRDNSGRNPNSGTTYDSFPSGLQHAPFTILEQI